LGGGGGSGIGGAGREGREAALLLRRESRASVLNPPPPILPPLSCSIGRLIFYSGRSRICIRSMEPPPLLSLSLSLFSRDACICPGHNTDNTAGGERGGHLSALIPVEPRALRSRNLKGPLLIRARCFMRSDSPRYRSIVISESDQSEFSV